MGYLVSVHQQMEGRGRPATFDSVAGAELAFWFSSTFGLDWIDVLVGEAKAIGLGGNAYPSRYTLTLANFLPEIVQGPPPGPHRGTSLPDAEALRPDEETWVGSDRINRAVIAKCSMDEWLLVDCWDST